MPTSGAKRLPESGFTLLEVIVVLAIMGMATALVAPSAIRGIDSWRRQAVFDALNDQVRSLPARARSTGVAIVLDDDTLAGDAPPLRMDPGWQVSAPEPWRVHANGACDGGRLLVRDADGDAWWIEVAAPFCEPRPGGA